MGQFRRLGCSLDYSRERFTMDDGYVDAVMTYFVRLWDAGWIYRANRIVNWCPYHQTAISDLEVEHVEMDDTLTYARYPFADGSGSITIATVRPATILADVAVAVHPGRPALPGRDRQGGRRPGGRPARAGASPTRASSPSSAPARSRSRPATTRPTSRSAATTACRRLTVIGPDGRVTADGFEGLTQEEAEQRSCSTGCASTTAAREARELPPLGRHLRALPLADRAARLAAVVVPDGRARRARRSRR